MEEQQPNITSQAVDDEKDIPNKNGMETANVVPLSFDQSIECAPVDGRPLADICDDLLDNIMGDSGGVSGGVSATIDTSQHVDDNTMEHDKNNDEVQADVSMQDDAGDDILLGDTHGDNAEDNAQGSTAQEENAREESANEGNADEVDAQEDTVHENNAQEDNADKDNADEDNADEDNTQEDEVHDDIGSVVGKEVGDKSENVDMAMVTSDVVAESGNQDGGVDEGGVDEGGVDESGVDEEVAMETGENQGDDVIGGTEQTDDVIKQTTQADDVNKETSQGDDEANETSQADNGIEETSQGDEAEKTSQADDEAKETSQADDEAKETSQTDNVANENSQAEETSQIDDVADETTRDKNSDVTMDTSGVTENEVDECPQIKETCSSVTGEGDKSGDVGSLETATTSDAKKPVSSSSKTTQVKQEVLDAADEKQSDKSSTGVTTIKSEPDVKDSVSNVDEPRRLRKNRNPVARYGYEGNIKDELIDLDELEDFGDEYIDSSNGIKVKDKKVVKPAKSIKPETPQQQRGRASQLKPAQSCIVCKKAGKCKFNIVRNGDTKHLCDDNCFKAFRAAPTRYLKNEKEVRAPPKAAILTCSVCQVMNINAKKPFITWNNMDMCSEDCLSKFKVNLGTCCGHCGSHITLSARGNTTTKIGQDLKQFCTTQCLADFKKHRKVCSTCEKDLAGNPDAFVAPTGASNEFKDFCSPDCLSRYAMVPNPHKNVTVTNVDQRVIQPCAVCSKVKPAKHSVDLDKKKHYMCSAPCLSAFQYANKLSTSCDNCGAQCYNEQTPPQFIQFEGFQKRFCCTNCVNVFRTKNKKLKPCTWCRTKKINFDMIERVDANNEYQLFCSLNCLSLYRVNLQATSNQIVTCDNCKKIAPAQYHLTMSDASVRNFCTYTCVMTFQSAFNAASNGTVPQKGSVMANKQAVPGKKNDPATMPIISSVMSLAPAKNKQIVNIKGASAIKGASVPPVVQVVSNKKLQQTPAAPPPPVQVTRQIVVQPVPPKECRNKAVICRPFVQTKATSCRPHLVDGSTQTDKELMPSAFVPIPVPIFVPVPMAMFSAKTPICVPIPVPVPVPIFLPTTKKTAAGVAKKIKSILEKVPTDPLEAELLSMAAAVSTDKKDSLSDESDEEEYTPPPPPKSTNSVMEAARAEGMSEDMLQMALRMASEMTGNSTDVEAHLSQKTIIPPPPIPQYQEPIQPEPIAPVRQIETRKRTRTSSGRGRGRGGRGKRSRVDDDSPPPEEPTHIQPPPPPPQPQVSPDAEYHLKFMYGVNAWKHWVVMKNQQISQLPRRLQGAKLRFFKTDLLQCTSDEINYSLCLFVKER